jgi:acyl transferase domain-containing protein/NAD(P)-dependent dehydrogenase (short-subunit alcohol dehydrogenase family)/acyl carrier protein
MTKQNDVTALMKNALIELQTLRGKLKSKEEPIAILGVGCRFPGASDPDAFWGLIEKACVLAGPQPENRWDAAAYYDPDPEAQGKTYLRRGSFLDNIDGFDADFFGVSPREALKMDPQQRLLLEVSREALENAGLPPERLSGTATAVFMGAMHCEYLYHRARDIAPADLDAYLGTGNESSFMAGRISYLLGLTGPSMVVATACSSSLVTVHLACQALRNGECDLALAGGVNLILSPFTNIALSKMQAVAADGRSKTFDAGADGFGRGEGCGVVVLKRLSAAVRDGDPILAVIRGSAIGHNGASAGLTVPNGTAQEGLIRAALRNANVEPDALDYVEAHGTGTVLGDPIEIQALARAVGKRERPLPVGSLKSNIGHLEAAAGVASLIKVVLAMQHGAIPPQPALNEPNPHIPWSELPIRIPDAPTPWPAGGKRRFAGVSSFGLSGSNAHVIVEEPPVPAEVPSGFQRPCHVLTLSAKTPEALRQMAAQYAGHLDAHPEQDWADVCFTSNCGRDHFEHRLAVVAATSGEARGKLLTAVGGSAGVFRGAAHTPPKTAFLFTGQGAQYEGMARDLYDSQPVFRAAMDRCDQILQPYLGESLLEILKTSRIDRTEYTQPAIFAIGCSLAEMWRSWGIVPSVVLGHSVGEYAAARVAGVFSLEDGLKLIAERARLMQSLPEDGAMAAVSADEGTVRAAIGGHPQIDIAAINGPRNISISGNRDAVDAVLADMQSSGISATRLTVSHAFHSSLMEPMLAEFERLARTVRFSAPRTHLVSNVTGRPATALLLTDPLYWSRQIRQPVRFADCMAALQRQGVDALIEIGPKPVLLGMGRQCLPTHEGAWLPSLRQGQSCWKTLLTALGELYVRGAAVDWPSVHTGTAAERRKVALPTYPFQRTSYWLETAAPSDPRTTPQLAFADTARLEALMAASTDLTDVERQLLPGVLAWLARQGQPSKSDVVFDYYNALSRTKSGAQAGADPDAEEPFLTFGPLAETVPGFSWLRTLAHPEEHAEFVRLGRGAQEEMRELLFQKVDFSTCRRALDFGCGYGSDVLRLAARHPHLELTGYTISSEQARIGSRKANARGLSGRVHIQHRDSARDEFPDGLDLAFGFEVAHHIEDKPALFGNIGGHLKENGLLVLADFISNAEFPIEHAETSSYFVTKDEWVRLLSSNHLELAQGIDISQEAANYLDDPDFAGNLAEIDRAGLDPNIKRALESYNQLGRLLRKGLASYVLLTARKRSDVAVEELEKRNRAAIGAMASYEESSPRRWLYERVWRPSALLPATANRPAGEPAGESLVFGDTVLGPRLADRLECTLATPGTAFQRLGHRHWSVRPGHREDFTALLREIGSPVQQVAFLWSLDSTGVGDVLKGSGSVLHLVQALAECGYAPRLCLVTRALRPEQAAIWGISGAIAREHEEFRCRRIELDPWSSTNEVDWLAAEMASPDPEDQIAYRGDTRQVARLTRVPSPDAAPTVLDPDAVYLITGGLGALGLQVAERLVGAGARNLALTGRRGLNGKDEAIGRLERLGATVRVFATDVADAEAVESMIREIPQLRGVIHAAGILDDGVLLRQSVERFAKVLAPKVEGAWNLHVATLGMALDFFVCFSSLASLIGSPGQGSYAAGNAFLDALAHHRRAIGLSALSINWGPWADSGMAAETEGSRRLSGQGIGSLDPRQSLDLFVRLLGLDAPQIGVAAIDWRRFPGAQGPFFAECVSGAAASGAPAEYIALRSKVVAAAPAERLRLLIVHLQNEVGRILGRTVPPLPDQGFMDLGVDSLMSIELRNCVQAAFGVSLSATLVFQYSTIRDLAEYIGRECIGEDAQVSAPSAAVKEPQDNGDGDTATNGELAEELARLKTVLLN